MSKTISAVELEHVLAAWRNLKLTARRAQFGTSDINHVITARHTDLLAHSEALIGEAQQLGFLDPYDSVASGGSRLHVPFEAHEQSVSNWLAWVLRADVIRDAVLRSQVISKLLASALQDEAVNVAPGYSVEE